MSEEPITDVVIDFVCIGSLQVNNLMPLMFSFCSYKKIWEQSGNDRHLKLNVVLSYR